MKRALVLIAIVAVAGFCVGYTWGLYALGY